ncbi:HU family DNA-binding protein [Porphyromonas sp.]
MLQYRRILQEAKLGKNKSKKVYRTLPVTRGKVSFEAFCSEISESFTVSLAGVKVLLSHLYRLTYRTFDQGFSVEVRELGTFFSSLLLVRG